MNDKRTIIIATLKQMLWLISQVLIILVFAWILTWVFMQVLECFTFRWDNEKFQKEGFHQLILDKVEDEYFMTAAEVDSATGCYNYKNATLCFNVRDIEDKTAVTISCKGDGCGDTFPGSDSLLYVSRFNVLTGVRTTKANDPNILKLGKKLSQLDGDANRPKEREKNTGIRWFQATMGVIRDTNRWNSRLMGDIQLLIYFFSMVTVTLIVIDVGFLRQNRKQLKELVLLKDNSEVVNRNTVEEAIEKIEKERKKSMFHSDFEPQIVFDILQPSLESLNSYDGAVNRGELIATVESYGESVQAGLEQRFSLVRYFVTAIPGLGFIGTVLGISKALSMTSALTGDSLNYERILANEALGESLYVAFDTTLIGLVANLILQFFIDWLENRELSLVATVRQRAVNRFSLIKEIKSVDNTEHKTVNS